MNDKLEELRNELRQHEDKPLIDAFNNFMHLLFDELDKKKKRWRAEKNDDYFYITSDLEVEGTIDCRDSRDDKAYKYHNYFKTKEEAQAVVDNIKTHIELMELAEELNTEPVDWNNFKQRKYYLIYDYENNTIISDSYWSCFKIANTVYCTNSIFNSEAVKRIGRERLTKYLKGE